MSFTIPDRWREDYDPPPRERIDPAELEGLDDRSMWRREISPETLAVMAHVFGHTHEQAQKAA